MKCAPKKPNIRLSMDKSNKFWRQILAALAGKSLLYSPVQKYGTFFIFALSHLQVNQHKCHQQQPYMY